MSCTVYLYTDGACKGNPGPGGWGYLLKCGENSIQDSGSEKDTTNNRMELMAVINGLSKLNRFCNVIISTDSQYVKNGMEEWIHNWKKNGWKSSNKKPVKNVDLWQQLDALVQKFNASWEWVKGHSGHVENEIVDTLASNAAESIRY